MTRAPFTRETPDVRRTALIEAAARVLAAKGVAGASVRTICAEAGVSAGLLRHYFDGVDALIAEAYEAVGALIDAALEAAVAAAGEHPRARLSAYLTASFAPPVLDPNLLATWLAFWSLVKVDPAIGAIHRRTYAGYRARLEELLTACDPAVDACVMAPGCSTSDSMPPRLSARVNSSVRSSIRFVPSRSRSSTAVIIPPKPDI